MGLSTNAPAKNWFFVGYLRWAVGSGWWFGTWILFIHLVGNVSIPTDSYFSEGLAATTNQGFRWVLFGCGFHKYHKVVPPNVINWFINPINYRYLTNKNHSYWSYKPTERYRTGAPPCRWGPLDRFFLYPTDLPSLSRLFLAQFLSTLDEVEVWSR